MAERIPCTREGCSNTILPATAVKTGGYCMPCKQEMEREERQRYIEANRRDVNLYAGKTDEVEILKIMHEPLVRDPLIRYVPYERSKEEVYLSLSVEQQEEMKGYAMELIHEGDEDEGKDILLYLVCYHDLALTAEIQELLEEGIYDPAILYKSASPEVRDSLLQQVNTDDENRNHILLILAYIGDEVVVQQFLQWRQSPPTWASELYVAPEHYTTEAGWELTQDGQQRELFMTPSYSVHEVKDETVGEKISILIPASNHCSWCGGSLMSLMDLHVKHPALQSLKWPWPRVKIETCLVCSCYGVMYMEMDEAGNPVWSPYNVKPEGLDYVDTEWTNQVKEDEGRLHSFHIASHPRQPFHGSEWAMEPSMSQVGGHPGWIQDADYPVCTSCSTRMKVIGQLDGGLTQENGEGMYYMFVCESCEITAVSYQQS